MTPKEKAEELINKFWLEMYVQGLPTNPPNWRKRIAKKYALIAVDEIQEAVTYLDDDSEDYWFEVKKEIELL